MSLKLKQVYSISSVKSTYCPNPRRKKMSGVEKSENFMVEKPGLWKFRVEARGWKVQQGYNILKPFVIPWVTILVTTEFGKYHLPSWLPSGDGKPTVLLSVIPVILVSHKNMSHVCDVNLSLICFSFLSGKIVSKSLVNATFASGENPC